MWWETGVFYQIYPLGLCGAPTENDGQTVPRIRRVEGWVEYLKKLGVNAVYFSPVFESDSHGYDTRDYTKIDCRLGSNDDFAALCAHLHEAGLRVVLDGVFNHVGRGFFAFQDLLVNREASRYKDWFFVDFGRQNGYGDGLFYEGWEGHYELVKLNLKNPEVKEYLFSCVRGWAEQFGIDGLRLDVAYCLDKDFLRELRAFCNGLKSEFLLLGEVLFGDYRQIVNDAMCHSCTNYECYKGLYSSFNTLNLFEINYSLNRQFGAENWMLYRGLHLLSFVDNHDVTRLASVLQEKRHIPLAWALLFGMPGIPCVYYGSEWGAQGRKEDGDAALRPRFEAPAANELTGLIEKLAHLRTQSRALCYGGYCNLLITNRQIVFARECEGETVVVAINADGADYFARFAAPGGQAAEMLTGQQVDLSQGVNLPPYSYSYWEIGG